jgi:3-deoxy-D-manno-octulosonic-acid transferase
VAPRHIERSEKIAEFYRKKGLRVKLTTDKDPEPEFDCLILNQLGVLKKLYAMADVVYVGGSLVRHGGQNPIEAANFKRPILHGPHVFNFENIYRQLDQEGGAILVSDEFQFAFAMKRLLGNTSEAEKLGARAYAIIEKLRGATHHHVEWLLKFLSSKTQTERMNHVQVPENLLPSSR